MRSDDEILSDAKDVLARYANTPMFRIAGDALELLAERDCALARAVAAEAETERLKAENAELSAANELMATQFRTMQQEKEHGWQEADRQETRAERVEADRDALRERVDSLLSDMWTLTAERDALLAAVAKVRELIDHEWSKSFGLVPRPQLVAALAGAAQEGDPPLKADLQAAAEMVRELFGYSCPATRVSQGLEFVTCGVCDICTRDWTPEARAILTAALGESPVAAVVPPTHDHPHTDPGDGRSRCETCGKFVWPVTHSCKGVRVALAATPEPDEAK
jgi:hypothetical protein